MDCKINLNTSLIFLNGEMHSNFGCFLLSAGDHDQLNIQNRIYGRTLLEDSWCQDSCPEVSSVAPPLQRYPLYLIIKRCLSGEAETAGTPWEQLSVGEKISGLYAILSQLVDPHAAASFLAAIKDPIIQEDEVDSSGSAEIGWKYVKAAYEEIIAEWGGLSEELYSIDKAHKLVRFALCHLIALK